jgi:ATP-dependent protease ClpP protease subunit
MAETIIVNVCADECTDGPVILISEDQDVRKQMPLCVMRSVDGKRILDIYITTAINEPMLYSEAVSLLIDLNEGDEAHLWLHTVGGHLSTSEYLSHAMRESKAKIVGHAVGEVMSAGTFLLINCDEVVISPFAVFMFHSASTIIAGKVAYIQQYTGAVRNYLERYFTTAIAKGYITQEEYERIAGDSASDVYLTGVRVRDRLEKIKEAGNE